jgi:hypothetical protein
VMHSVRPPSVAPFQRNEGNEHRWMCSEPYRAWPNNATASRGNRVRLHLPVWKLREARLSFCWRHHQICFDASRQSSHLVFFTLHHNVLPARLLLVLLNHFRWSWFLIHLSTFWNLMIWRSHWQTDAAPSRQDSPASYMATKWLNHTPLVSRKNTNLILL